MAKQKLLYEGKAKQIYTTDDAQTVCVAFKNDVTADNGQKEDAIQGKAELNNAISAMLFAMLAQEGIPSHFIKKVSATAQRVQSVAIMPLEVVVRNVVAGSLARRTGYAEGTALSQPLIEYYYKNDALGDPLLNQAHIQMLKLASAEQVEAMTTTAVAANRVLSTYFARLGMTLVDFKLEFGRQANGSILLADEISPDTCRLWDTQTNEKLDKDVFRRDLGSVTAAYNDIYTRLKAIAH